MAGDALAAMEALDGVGGDAHVHLFFDERMGHGVVMAMDLDVIVDVDPGLLPLGVFVRVDGKWAQGRFIQLLKQGAPGARQFLEGPVVERLEQRPDGAVQLGQGEALTVAQRGKNPSLYHLYRDLGLRLVTGTTHPRRDDGYPVMRGQVLVGGVDIRLIPMRLAHPGA